MIHKFIYLFSLTCLIGANPVSAQDRTSLVAPGAELQVIAEGFEFTEGPVSNAAGDLYFSDIPNNRIHLLSTDGTLSVFRENSGGANGLYFDNEGNLLVCEGAQQTNRRITRITLDGDVTVLADNWQGKRFNSPNDLWMRPDGGIYFSDPRYFNYDDMDLDGYYIFFIPPEGGPVVRVADDLEKPNGIIGTPNGDRVYISDADVTYVYDVNEDGSLSNRQVAADMGSDGMTLDSNGNLYLTRGGVQIYSPEGQKIVTIRTPFAPTNVTFRGPDKQTLIITGATPELYSLRMNVRGI
ncbi:MAG: SMP-30/gluconolactonase/LRE family protein [Pseudomonadales bacterium]|nr:SMP-30/gluconolactonase/LRE family protein [Pseudomonadales bacterium]